MTQGRYELLSTKLATELNYRVDLSRELYLLVQFHSHDNLHNRFLQPTLSI